MASWRSGNRRTRHRDAETRSSNRSNAGRASRRSGGASENIDSNRVFLPVLVFVALAAIVFIRLFYLQVIVANEYSENAEASRTIAVNVEARRGTIYDRNGNVLAISVDATTVYCNPSEVTDPAYAAQLGRAARQRALVTHDPQRNSRALETIYQTIAE